MSVLDFLNLLVDWAYENYFFCIFLFWAGAVLGWMASIHVRLNEILLSQAHIEVALQEAQERQPTWKRRRRLIK